MTVAETCNVYRGLVENLFAKYKEDYFPPANRTCFLNSHRNLSNCRNKRNGSMDHKNHCISSFPKESHVDEGLHFCGNNTLSTCSKIFIVGLSGRRSAVASANNIFVRAISLHCLQIG